MFGVWYVRTDTGGSLFRGTRGRQRERGVGWRKDGI